VYQFSLANPYQFTFAGDIVPAFASIPFKSVIQRVSEKKNSLP
jgi:hypothetical protein